MPTGGSGDVAVFDRHGLTSLVEYALLVRPNVGHRYVEPVNPSLECVDEPREPRLQGLTLAPFFGADSVCELRDDDGARVAAVLLQFEPGNHPRIAVPLGWLADNIRIEKPAHSLRRREGARRRGGTSFGLTGQALSTVNQFSLPANRRNTSASSSGSKRASK